VELAGAMKNVMAIAPGRARGSVSGSNALAALITRGLAEMARLAVALERWPETLSGLAGLAIWFSLARARSAAIALWESNSAKDVL